jgi:nucleotide-binding universal stress UspA family protein
VVVATDGSASSELAVELARSIQWPSECVIWLVTVLEREEDIVSGAWAPVVSVDLGERMAQMADEAETLLSRTARSLASSGRRIETAVLRGRPGTAIVDKAESVAADLIILGSRGHGTIASMLLGSTSAEIVDHAHCPVLVARQPSLSRAVLGTDGSSYARTAEDVVRTWTIFERVPVEVVSVARSALSWTSSLVLSASPASPAEMEQAERELLAEYQRTADETRARLRSAGREAESRVIEGDPAAELLHVAKASAADLIVVGTHGSTGLRRLLAGSVARNVMVHAPCSVMVVREARPLT